MLSIFQDQKGLESHYRKPRFTRHHFCKSDDKLQKRGKFFRESDATKEEKNFTLVAKVSALLTQKRRKRDD